MRLLKIGQNLTCNRKRKENAVLYIVVSLLSMLLFCLIYGVKVLNPMYTDWLMNGSDLSQHYLGWVAYRKSQWFFPIGLTDYLAYPDKTSIIFTDSIPVFAVFFKLLSPLLPDQFQYFGLWGLLCFVLQGVLSARIIRRYSESGLYAVLGSELVVCAPVMIYRMFYHTSLAGQWIILLSLDTVFSLENYKKNNKILISTAIIAVFASGIHMYFVLMCGVVVFSYSVGIFLEKKWKGLLCVFIYCASSLLTIALLGGFSSAGSTYETVGLGFFSANLNALFNPQGWSVILPDLEVYTDGQYEGFAYLGLGVVFLLVAVSILLVLSSTGRKRPGKNKEKVFMLLLISILILIIALSPVASLGKTKLYELKLPLSITKLWSVFRASGRIAMVIDYVVVLSLLVILSKFAKKEIVVAFCLILQVCDLGYIIKEKQQCFSEEKTYISPLKEKIWDSIADNGDIKHIVITSWLGNDYYDLAEWALNNNKTMSSFALAHADPAEIWENADKALANPQKDSIFLFSSLFKENNLTSLHYYQADDYILGYTEKIGNLPETDKPVSQRSWFFGNNEYLINGRDSESGRTLYPAGTSYGPYWSVPEGEWLITINGTDFTSNAEILINCDGGETHLNYEILEQTGNTVRLRVELARAITDLEVVITNHSDRNILLDSLSICFDDD